MPTTPIAPVPTAATTPKAASTNGGFAATADTFMKLLVENLKHQDPMKPQDASEYMAQVSQMTMVQQLTQLTDQSASQAKDQAVSRTVALLGHTVSYLGDDGLPASGVVEKVDVSGKTPTVTVGGTAGIDPARVTEVA